MLGRVDRPSAYACATDGDKVVAVGRAVADEGWAGVYLQVESGNTAAFRLYGRAGFTECGYHYRTAGH